nr:lytic murein transglycosylase B [Aidingimonas lacisalsi]
MSSSVEAARFDPDDNPDAAALIDELVAQGGDRAWLESTLSDASFEQTVLDAMDSAAEGRLRWDEYRDIFLTDERIEQGVAFIEDYADAFERVEARYGVPREFVAAIIGVETAYGRHTGRHRVLDSLATLAFEHPSRGGFFRSELAAFLQITSQEDVDPRQPKGSYAGAMGYPQFIPTSYRAYAVDFDGDGVRDLLGNPVDAIGSVGNYFAEHGWQSGEPVVSRARGPSSRPDGIDFNATREPYVSLDTLSDYGIDAVDELPTSHNVVPIALDHAADDGVRYTYWLGHHNFYVITRYNHSHLYAMAVTELADAIRDAREAR